MKLEKILSKKIDIDNMVSHYGVIIDGNVIVTNRHLAIVSPLKNFIKEQDTYKLEGCLFDYEAIKLLSSKDNKNLVIEEGCLKLGNVEYKAVDRYNEEGKFTRGYNYPTKKGMMNICFVEEGEPCIVKAIAGKQLALFEEVMDLKNSYTIIRNVKGKENEVIVYLKMAEDNSGSYAVLAGIEKEK